MNIQKGCKGSNMMKGVRGGIKKLVHGRNRPEHFRTAAGLFTQLAQSSRWPAFTCLHFASDHSPLSGINHVAGSPENQKTHVSVGYGVGINIYQFI